MTVPVDDTAYQVAADTVRTVVENLRNLWNTIVDGVNFVCSLFPALQAGIMAAFNDLAARFTAALDQISKMIAELGDPGAIRQVASGWNTVGETTSGQGALLKPALLAGVQQWSGEAATNYRDVVVIHSTALTDVKTITDKLSTALTEVADELSNFWVMFAAESAAYVVAMVVAAAALPTGAGTIPAILGMVSLTVGYLGLMAKQYTDFTNKLASKANELKQLNGANSNFPDGQWPKTTTSPVLNDATVRDGNPSKWAPR